MERKTKKTITNPAVIKEFSERLGCLMNAKEVTQLQLAKAIGTSRQAVAKYADGKVQPNIEKLYMIAKHFNVTTDYLLGLTNSQSTDLSNVEIGRVLGLSDSTIDVLSKSVNGFDLIEWFTKLALDPSEDDPELPDDFFQKISERLKQPESEQPIKNNDYRNLYLPTHEIINMLCNEINETVYFRSTILQLIGDYLLHVNNAKAKYGVHEHKKSKRGKTKIDDSPFANVTDEDLLAVRMLKIQQALNKLKTELDEERAKKEEQAKKKEGQKYER